MLINKKHSVDIVVLFFYLTITIYLASGVRVTVSNRIDYILFAEIISASMSHYFKNLCGVDVPQ